jgi:hypothetical protein
MPSLRRGTNASVSKALNGGVMGLLRQFRKLNQREKEWRKPIHFRNGINSRRAKNQKSIGNPAGVTFNQICTDSLKGKTLNAGLLNKPSLKNPVPDIKLTQREDVVV